MNKSVNTASLKTGGIVDFLGVFLVITGVLQYIVPAATGNFVHFAWFSNHVIILLGIGIILRNRFLVTAELCIALIPETVWSVDFLGKVFFNTYLIGITRYMFEWKFDFVIVV